MSQVSQGPGWWLASDGRWYPPETLARSQAAQVARAQAAARPASPTGFPAGVQAQAPYQGQAQAPATTWTPNQTAQPAPGAVLVGVAPGTPAGDGRGPVAWGVGAPTPGMATPGGTPEAMGYAAVNGPYPQAAAYAPYPAFGPHTYTWQELPGDPTWPHRRVMGLLIVLVGVAGLVWGIGAVYIAAAVASAQLVPHNEILGQWLAAVGILLVALSTIAAGLVHRRP